MTYPLNHVAISVPDAAAASKWYVEVMGFQLLRPLTTVDRAKMPNAAIFKIYPSDLNKVTTCCMSTTNGIGIELFQFHDPKITAETSANFANDYKRGGFFHIGVTAPDIEALAQKAIAAGAKKIGETVPVFDQEAMYIEDPWGNVVELVSVSFERLMSNRS